MGRIATGEGAGSKDEGGRRGGRGEGAGGVERGWGVEVGGYVPDTSLVRGVGALN